MELQNKKKISLGAENMILRGCKLRNTEHVFGLAVFTGHDSKIMMNSQSAKYKFSSLETMSNKGILYVLITQFSLSIISGFMGTTWIFDQAIKNDDGYVPAWYLQFGYQSEWTRQQSDSGNDKSSHIGPALQFIYMTLTWVIIYTNMLPISMMVSLEVIKVIQALFMSFDNHMIQPKVMRGEIIEEVDIPARA